MLDGGGVASTAVFVSQLAAGGAAASSVAFARISNFKGAALRNVANVTSSNFTANQQAATVGRGFSSAFSGCAFTGNTAPGAENLAAVASDDFNAGNVRAPPFSFMSLTDCLFADQPRALMASQAQLLRVRILRHSATDFAAKAAFVYGAASAVSGVVAADNAGVGLVMRLADAWSGENCMRADIVNTIQDSTFSGNGHGGVACSHCALLRVVATGNSGFGGAYFIQECMVFPPGGVNWQLTSVGAVSASALVSNAGGGVSSGCSFGNGQCYYNRSPLSALSVTGTLVADNSGVGVSWFGSLALNNSVLVGNGGGALVLGGGASAAAAIDSSWVCGGANASGFLITLTDTISPVAARVWWGADAASLTSSCSSSFFGTRILDGRFSFKRGSFRIVSPLNAPPAWPRSIPGGFSAASFPCTACSSGEGFSASTCSCSACSQGSAPNALDVCAPCAAGTFASSVGSASCTQCPAGISTLQPGSTSVAACAVCAPGYYGTVTSSGTANATGCLACPGGTFSSVNAQSCSSCLAGTFSSAAASSCSSCAGGTYSAARAWNCSVCLGGTFSSAGAPSCSSCLAGTYSAAGASKCSSCAPSTYSPSAGATSCTACSAGTHSASGAASCASCTFQTYSYGYGASTTPCSSCSASATFVSAANGCAPSAALTPGPPDTVFYLSGSAIEGVSALALSGPAPTFTFDHAGTPPNSALSLDGSTHLDVAGARAPASMPSGGTVAFSASAWVRCAPPAAQPHAAVLEWGAAGDTGGLATPRALALVVSGSANGGVVTTLAGGDSAGESDGVGPTAHFQSPGGLAVIPSSGLVVVADSQNSHIRLVSPLGKVSTLAGSWSGYADGSGTAAAFSNPSGVAVVPSSENVVVADSQNSRIRLVTPQGLVSTLAGSGSSSFANGQGAAASFNNPRAVAVIPSSEVIVVADQKNFCIRLVTPSGLVSTLAGRCGYSSYAPPFDGTGSAALFGSPVGVAVIPGSERIVVADAGLGRVRLVSPLGVVTTLAGGGSGLQISPQSVAVLPSRFVAVAVTGAIVLVSPLGTVSQLAGSHMSATADGTGTAASFRSPSALAVVPSSGALIVADYSRISLVTVPRVLPACDSAWHHVALTFSPLSAPYPLSGFLDGALVFASPSTVTLPSAANSSLRIGWSGDASAGSGSPFAGSLSDLRVYARALEAAEVALLAGVPPPAASPSASPQPSTTVVRGAVTLSGAPASAYASSQTILDLTAALTQAAGPSNGFIVSPQIVITGINDAETDAVLYSVAGSAQRRRRRLAPTAAVVAFNMLFPASIYPSQLQDLLAAAAAALAPGSPGAAAFASSLLGSLASVVAASHNTALAPGGVLAIAGANVVPPKALPGSAAPSAGGGSDTDSGAVIGASVSVVLLVLGAGLFFLRVRSAVSATVTPAAAEALPLLPRTGKPSLAAASAARALPPPEPHPLRRRWRTLILHPLREFRKHTHSSPFN